MDLVVDPRGVVRAVYGELVDLASLGRLAMARASHVEPTPDGLWTADLAPVGGPALGPFRLRSEALAAEQAWLTGHWLTRPERTTPVTRSGWLFASRDVEETPVDRPLRGPAPAPPAGRSPRPADQAGPDVGTDPPAVACPSCGRPVPDPGTSRDGSAALAECLGCDLYFAPAHPRRP